MTFRCALRGVEHPLFGTVTARAAADRRSGLALATGGDPAVLRWHTKGSVHVPNEDACAVVDDGDRVLLVVADAHFGHAASHELVDAIVRGPIPPTPAALDDLLGRLAGVPCAQPDSATTLAVAVLDRRSRRIFGRSFADSTIAAVDARRVVRYGTPATDFVTPGSTWTFDAGQRIDAVLPAGAWLVLFTDGVDGCGGADGPSIGDAELHALAAVADAAEFATALVRAALDGVGGAPGGHDNVAVAAASAD